MNLSHREEKPTPSRPEPPDPARVEKIFLRLIDLPTADRVEALDADCGTDDALRAEVLSLLEHHGQGSGFLDSKDAPGRGLLTQLGARTLADSEPLLPEDRRIGRYEVLGVLGAGGMGVVYVARQDRPRRTVAVKVMRRLVGDPGSPSAQRVLRRFEHEAELLGRLHHPGIAQIYEAGTYEAHGATHPYIAMELVKGQPLLAYAQERNLGVRERLTLIERVCEAVQHAHRNGVIHRDLKPANILVDESGRPRVLDFGVARSTSREFNITSEHTGVGQLIGTLPYMSPEQVTGNPDDIDTRSDVYAIGVVLYQLLASRLPYALEDRSLPEAARIIRDEDPTPLSSVDRVFRGDIEMLVLKALEKDRSRRYQSASDLGDDLARYLAGQPIAARRDSALYVLRKQIRRYRGVVTTAVVFVLLLACAGVFSAIQAVRASRLAQTEQTAKDEALANLRIAETERKRASEIARDLRIQLDRSSVERGRLLGLSGNLTEAEDLIWPAHLRDPTSRHTFFALWELYMHEPCVGAFEAHDAPISLMASTRDGSLVATVSDQSPTLRLLEPDRMATRATITLPTFVTRGLRFSPDASRLVLASQSGDLMVFETTAGSEVARSSSAGRVFHDVDFAPGSGELLVAAGDGSVLRADASTGAIGEALLVAPTAALRIAVRSSDGLIATGHDNGIVRLWSSNGQSQRVLRGHTREIGSLTFSRDGRFLASGGGDRIVRVWDVETGENLAALDSPNGNVRGLRFSADSSVLYAGGWWSINIWDWRGSRLVRRLMSPITVIETALSENETVIWSAVGNVLRGWNTAELPAMLPLTPHVGRAMAAWSADGTFVVTGDGEGTVRVFDATSGELRRSMQAGGQRLRAVAIDASSTRIVVAGEGSRAFVFNLQSPHPEPELVVEDIRAFSPRSIAFSPDNAFVILPGTQACHRVFRFPSMEEVRRIPTVRNSESLSARFSPDGSLLATNDRDRAVRLWRLPGFELIGTLRPDNLNPQPWSFEFTPDSKEILLTTWNKDVELWDTTTLQRKLVFRGHGGLVTDVAIRPREPMVFFTTSVDGTARLWNRDHVNEPSMLTISRFGGLEANSVAWSPDGRRVVFGDSVGNAQIWNMRFFNRHVGGNMAFQLERHRATLGPDAPLEEIERQRQALTDRNRAGW